MKIAAALAALATISLFLGAGTPAQEHPRSPAKPAGPSLSSELAWMARTYKFTQAEVHSDRTTLHKHETDDSLAYQGCRMTLKETYTIFDSTRSGKSETTKWKKVIDLSTLDLSSIQLKRAPDAQKRPYFVLEFATTGRYNNIELFLDGGARPAMLNYSLIPLFAGDAEYAPRFAKAFCHAVALCEGKPAAF
jgi:hypothetical protein